jgi:hypothetical protein
MGSLHKSHFKNENHSSFGWSALQSEISHLCSVYSIDEESTYITNIEFGLNVELPFPVYDFLRESLIGYKGEPFSRYKPDRRGVSLGYECGMQHYIVKAYDKGLQYGLTKNLLRFELSYKNMVLLRKDGVNTLSDLRDPEKVLGLSRRLLKAWDDVMLCEIKTDVKVAGISERDSKLLYDGSNPKYWEILKEDNKSSYNYRRRKYKKLIVKYGQGKQELVRKLLAEEWDRLMSL